MSLGELGNLAIWNCGLRLFLLWSEHQLLISITYSNQATKDEVKVLFEHFFLATNYLSEPDGSGTNQLRKMQWSSGRLPTKPKTGEAFKLQDANNVTLQPFLGHHLDILPDCDPVLLLPHCLVSTIATSFHFCATIMSLLGSHLDARNWKNPMQRSKQSGHRSKVWQFWQHLRPAAVLSGQFNSSTPGGLLCTALASSGEKMQEARRAFALRVTRHAIPPSRGADAVHATLAHRYAICLCSLDDEILPTKA